MSSPAVSSVPAVGALPILGLLGAILSVQVGAAFAKGLTFKMGQTHVHRYLGPLMQRIQNGEIDPSFVISHRLPLEEAAHGYRIFKEKKENCTKVVLYPGTA